MNREIGEALDLRNKLQRMYNKSPCQETRTAINQSTNRIRYLTGREDAEARIRELRLMAKNFQHQDSKSAWDAASRLLNNRKSRRKIISLKDDDGKEVVEDIGKANLLADSLGKVVEKPAVTSDDPSTTSFWEKTDREMEEDSGMKPLKVIPDQVQLKVTRRTVRRVLKKLKNFKAPGVDNIQNILLKKGGEKLVGHLQRLFQLSINCGYVPPSWKIAIVVPILKEGKDGELAASYRPVSLLSAIGKVLEFIVTNVITDFVESRHLLPRHQHGFRRRNATTDPVFRLVCDVALAMARHQKTVAVALDFKSAFDCIWHNGLRAKLKKLGLPEGIVRWVSDFLRGRTFQVRVHLSLSNVMSIDCGVPQGSPLSPLLFIIFTADMQDPACNPDDAQKKVGKGTYADDALNWASGKSYGHCVRRLQANLRGICSWCRTWRLTLNVDKCEVMAFGYYTKRPSLAIHLEAKRLPQVENLRYLGVVLTPRLCWEEHVSALSARVRPRAGRLAGIMAKNVLPKRIGVMFHKVYIESILTYAAPAWFCQPPSTRSRIFELQVHGLRSALALPYEADSYGVLYVANRVLGADRNQEYDPNKDADREPVPGIDDIFEKRLVDYGDRCFDCNPMMADFIRYMQTRDLDKFGKAMMTKHSPAWRLQRSSAVTLDPASLINHSWLQFRRHRETPP